MKYTRDELIVLEGRIIALHEHLRSGVEVDGSVERGFLGTLHTNLFVLHRRAERVALELERKYGFSHSEQK